jgi:anti-sigma factor RsiW
MKHNPGPISSEDPRLTAYVLGELEGVELDEIETAIAANPPIQAIVEQIRIAADHLRGAFVDEPIEGVACLRIQPSPPERRPSSRARRLWRIGYLSLCGLAAACVAILVYREHSRSLASARKLVEVDTKGDVVATGRTEAMSRREEPNRNANDQAARSFGDSTNGVRVSGGTHAAVVRLASLLAPARGRIEGQSAISSEKPFLESTVETPSSAGGFYTPTPRLNPAGVFLGGGISLVPEGPAVTFQAANPPFDLTKKFTDQPNARGQISGPANLGPPTLLGSVTGAAQSAANSRRVYYYIKDNGIFAPHTEPDAKLDSSFMMMPPKDRDKDFVIRAVPIPALAVEVLPTLTLKSDGAGKWQLDGVAIADRQLNGALAKAFAANPGAQVIIRADANLPKERISSVWDACRKAGFKNVRIQSE